MRRTTPLLLAAWSLGAALAQTLPVSIKVSDETTPAGAIAQVKVETTEPMPISHGGATVIYDPTLLDGAVGVNLISAAGDACGTAMVTSGRVSVKFASPSATMGTLPAGYPFLTIAIPVRPNAPAGASSPVSLDALALAGLLGLSYTPEIAGGSVTVGGGVAINNVLPGAGPMAAGQPFLIAGTGFQPGMMVRIDGFEKPDVKVLDGGTAQVAFAEPLTLDGQFLRLANPDGTGASYYSYLRAAPLGASSNALLAAVVPIPPARALSDALIASLALTGVVNGFAVENAGPQAAQVDVALYKFPGLVAARASFTLPAGMRLSRSLAEVLGAAAQAGLLRITASAPVRVMGLAADTLSGQVWPVPPIPTPAGF